MSDETPHRRRARAEGFGRRLTAVSTGDLVRLVIASAIVGVVLSLFGVDPARLWTDFFGAIADAFGELGPTLERAVRYVIFGAVIVVPIWVFFRVLGALFPRRED